jgi:hypothetical protein
MRQRVDQICVADNFTIVHDGIAIVTSHYEDFFSVVR